MAKKRKKQLRMGLAKIFTRPVEFRRTIAYYDKRLPPVLSTPSMIGQMEVAAALLLQPFLPRGAISVGTHINVSHRAPAILGEKVRATARFQRAYKPRNSRGLRYLFETEAHVGKRLIGAGTVERAVVEPHFAGPAPSRRRAR